MGSANAIMAGYHSPSWGEMLVANARFLRLKWLLVLYEGKLLSIGGCFLLGVALGKWRVYERIGELSPQLRRVAWVTGCVGIAGNLWLATVWAVAPPYPPTATGVFTNLLYAVAVPSLAIAIAAAFCLLWIRGTGRRILGAFAPPGRMALTTYLSQTAIGIGVFYGVGFGLRGTISLAEGLAVAFCVFGLQAMIARNWLRAFRYGPFEWGWRCATYGRLLPFRQRAHESVPETGASADLAHGAQTPRSQAHQYSRTNRGDGEVRSPGGRG